MKKAISSFTIALVFSSLFAAGQSPYSHDRVYAANQISNTVSVVDPQHNRFLGEIRLGKPFPTIFSPLYKGQTLVHGLRYLPQKKMLVVISIGSNSVTLVSTETNQVLKTIYVGRSPHEPTFTPDSKQIWVSVRGESYVSVIDVAKMAEVRRVPVADGPGMVAFTSDGKQAYVCSSFTPEVDIVNTETYRIIKRIPVTSPFSPNIYTSPDGKWIAMTHKDVGKVTVINTAAMSVTHVLNTGPITNHVTFSNVNQKLLMMVTVGGENKVKVFDVGQNFKLTNTIQVGALPHGIWPSADGKIMYIGLEYGDQVQRINLQTMKPMRPVQIGQSPQAVVYADRAVSDPKNIVWLSALGDSASTQVIVLTGLNHRGNAHGRLSVRSIGLTDLIEQNFTFLHPNASYTLALSKSVVPPFRSDYEINRFETDSHGKYNGQSTGLIKSLATDRDKQPYRHVILTDNRTKQVILLDNPSESF
ncbi:YncE family protein [Spirosoma spitsbergense]|uniref:YncE family protein n=1 Tax=Spirosoma spitsbergense TaxID=431554 RepID=UPI000363A1F5|nr:YncE family protein [Spirosoma spitsbergense]